MISMLAGALLSAVVFGASHGYEGGARMLLIGVFGFMFGLLAWWRRSLRPGMIAHAWHDALSGGNFAMPNNQCLACGLQTLLISPPQICSCDFLQL